MNRQSHPGRHLLHRLAPLLAAVPILASGARAQDGIVWETNDASPMIGSPEAQRGGTLHTYVQGYPLTFRLMGPNSNDGFSGWKRAFSMDLPLVNRHPQTDEFIPCLATHWSVQPDNKTVYYKLDPDARWSDGEPITADDYVFTLEMMGSEHILDPYYNNRAAEYYESVEKIDPYTIKIVGQFESWRTISEFGLWPMPKHAITLDENWIKDYNNKFPVVAGPYVITHAEAGRYVAFSRLDDWWGDDKKYFEGLYNVDEIVVHAIRETDRAFDFFKTGELSFYLVNTAKIWAEEMRFEAVRNGWAHRKRVFVDFPSGMYGFAMNLNRPVFQNKDFRKGLFYAFDFDEINENLMYNAYYRKNSVFAGTRYGDPELPMPRFDPKLAREHFAAAGFRKRGSDGILVDDAGTRASFTLTYGSPGLERHMTVAKQKFKRQGIEMNLDLLDPATAFERGLEKSFEMTIISRTSGLYPAPHQYFSSEFAKKLQNNNIFAFGTAYTDSLIDIYRFNLDVDARVQAMHELDRTIRDESFYIPFWDGPYKRFVYWDYVKWPEWYLPRRTEQLSDWHVFWIDTQREAQLEDAMAKGEAWTEDTEVDVDPYGIKARLEQGVVVDSGL